MKNGLGRGLDSLFKTYNVSADLEKNVSRETIIENKEDYNEVANKVIKINIGLIDPNKEQPRKKFNEEALKELADSIKIHGVLQPILVVKKDGRYLIVAGERRWRASKIAGLKEIPCVVENFTETEIKEISIIENLQREDLTPIEEARAIKSLMDEFGWSQEIIAERLGKSRPAIANIVRLLQLQPEVIKMIEEGKLSAGHARSLVVVNDKDAQIRLAKQVCEKKLTVRDLEHAVKNTKKPKGEATQQSNLSVECRALMQDMQRVFGTKVFMLGSENRGRIYLDYFNRDDLDRIFEIVEFLKNNNY